MNIKLKLKFFQIIICNASYVVISGVDLMAKCLLFATAETRSTDFEYARASTRAYLATDLELFVQASTYKTISFENFKNIKCCHMIHLVKPSRQRLLKTKYANLHRLCFHNFFKLVWKRRERGVRKSVHASRHTHLLCNVSKKNKRLALIDVSWWLAK